MKTQTLSIIAVFVLVIAGLLLWGRATSSSLPVSHNAFGESAAQSELVGTTTSYDFGTISMRDGDVRQDFTVTNPTDHDITVSTVVTSCMCTTAYLVLPSGDLKGPFGMEGMGYVPPANETIKAGETRTMRVVYDPNAHGPAGVGAIDRFIALTDSSGGTLEFEIKALVTP